VFARRSEFDDFLFTEIGEDAHGMPLTVLSALARVDLDPWVEAAQLARLSSAAAAERLASLIEPELDGHEASGRKANGQEANEQGEGLDLPALAARLVARLPKRGVASQLRPGAATAATAPRGDIHAIALSAALLALLLGAGWFMAARQLAPAAGPGTIAPVAAGPPAIRPLSANP
jgi:hypothetical protein